MGFHTFLLKENASFLGLFFFVVCCDQIVSGQALAFKTPGPETHLMSTLLALCNNEQNLKQIYNQCQPPVSNRRTRW